MAERDLRMIKVKQKISGTFTSRTGGKIFARIKGYISTVKKNGSNMMEELKNVFKGEAFVPVLVGQVSGYDKCRYEYFRIKEENYD